MRYCTSSDGLRVAYKRARLQSLPPVHDMAVISLSGVAPADTNAAGGELAAVSAMMPRWLLFNSVFCLMMNGHQAASSIGCAIV